VTALLASGPFLCILCAFLWAVAVILFRLAGEHYSPVVLCLFKSVVGLALFAITMLVLGLSWWPDQISAGEIGVLFVSGILGVGLADTLFFASLNRLGAGRTALIDCLYSPFVLLFSVPYLGEPVGPALVAAIVLMAGAIALGTWQSGGIAGPSGPSLRKGIVYGVLAMMLMALAIVIAKPVITKSHPVWVTTVRLAGGVAILLFQGLRSSYRAEVLRSFVPSPGWRIAIPATLVGNYISIIVWVEGIRLTPVAIASVLNQMSTLFVPVLAAVFLREQLGRRQWVALVIGFLAALLVLV